MSENFYTYGKKKMGLIPIDDVLVVRYKESAEDSTTRSLIASNPGAQIPGTHLKSFPRQRIVLVSRPITGVRTFAPDNLEADVKSDPNTEFVSKAFRDRQSGAVVYLTDEVTVRFKKDTKDNEIKEILKVNQLTVANEDEFAKNKYVLKVKDANGTNTLRIANRLALLEVVEFSEPNFLTEVEKLQLVAGSIRYFDQQWHLRNLGQSGGTPDEDVKALDAWNVCQGGKPEIVIAIIDDGVETEHDDLRNNILRDSQGKVVGKNFYDRDDDPNPRYFILGDKRKSDLHGTACAGVAAAMGRSVAGIAYHCRILPVKILGPDSVITNSEQAEAIRYAGRYADVISCSWGGGNASNDIGEAIQDVVSTGRGGKGCIVLFAAGNGDPTSNIGRPEVVYPAQHPNALAVGASTNMGMKASYSDYGRKLEFVAPSSGGSLGIFTTDVSRPGMGYDAGRPDPADPDGKYTKNFGGTSSATPLAAGVAALVLSINPNLTSTQVRQILRNSCEKIDPANAGYDGSGFSIYYGYGRINARRAIELAQETLQLQASQWQHFEEKPSAQIPDNNPAGITSSLTVAVDGLIGEIRMGVEIQHPYIGDLRIALLSSSGKEIILHNRSGAGQDNLVHEYSFATTPALSSLIGSPIRGTWKLVVTDNAAQDQGTLRKWYLDAVLMTAITGTSNTSIIIPDNSTAGASSVITLAGSAKIKDIRVVVDITHSYVGDLTITLTSPTGTQGILRDRKGGSLDNINETYDTTKNNELKKMIGEDVVGNWTLTVKDRQKYDKGKLNYWSIMLTT